MPSGLIAARKSFRDGRGGGISSRGLHFPEKIAIAWGTRRSVWMRG